MALLDFQAAKPEEREGQEPPDQDEEEAMAIAVVNALKNGQGGLDWAGLPVVCEWLGVADVAGLLQRLVVIKTWRPPAERAGGLAAAEE